MLEKWLNQRAIKLNLSVPDYASAIRAGGKLLVDDDIASDAYVDAMINAVSELGPYMVVAPGIAIAHARPEAGAKGIGFSLVTLQDPVDFGNPENDPVWLLICLCATDSTSHLEALQRLVAFLMDDKALDSIRHARHVDDVIQIVQAY
ncbi:PTS sugar transporter subunit IIA [Olsenella massiliensis]|uniref:PTS sugar transporter subunit IIA n=1 Tax=Olsenella massiliensis TaxID=1622075 RepID=UPI0009EC4832|nr:PTS sugar transporter subunit IIA [Olsenella massiliensis]